MGVEKAVVAIVGGGITLVAPFVMNKFGFDLEAMRGGILQLVTVLGTAFGVWAVPNSVK